MVTCYPMLSTAPRPSLIYRPGIRTLPFGVERYIVRGAGSTVVSVKAGDGVVLADIEGGQACEIAFCDETGRFDASALGARANSHGEGLKAQLAEDSESTQRIIGTSLIIGLILSSVTALFYGAAGSLNLHMALWMTGGSLLAMPLGRFVFKKISAAMLTHLVAGLAGLALLTLAASLLKS